MSVAVPADFRTQKEDQTLLLSTQRRKDNGGKNANGPCARLTTPPRGLGACIPILAVEAESEQIPSGVECNARGCSHCGGRKEEKSGEGGQ